MGKCPTDGEGAFERCFRSSAQASHLIVEPRARKVAGLRSCGDVCEAGCGRRAPEGREVNMCGKVALTRFCKKIGARAMTLIRECGRASSLPSGLMSKRSLCSTQAAARCAGAWTRLHLDSLH